VASAEDASPNDPVRTILDQILCDVSAVKADLADRLRYDKAKEEAFDRLYAQLDELRSDREFDQLKPLYLDLILLLDRLDQAGAFAPQHENGSMGAWAVIASLRDELVEILYRRDIELIDPSPRTFDPSLQRAIGTQDSDAPEKHNAVVSVVRRGFRFRNRLIRPEEVILIKYRAQG